MKRKKPNSHLDISKSTIKSSETENRDVRNFALSDILISVLSLETSDKFQPDK